MTAKISAKNAGGIAGENTMGEIVLSGAIAVATNVEEGKYSGPILGFGKDFIEDGAEISITKIE